MRRYPWSRAQGTGRLAFVTTLAFLGTILLPPCVQLAEAEERDKPTIRFFHYDHLGSVTLVTDEQGRVVESYTYKPFGEVDHHDGPSTSSHRFTGQRFDDSTGLYYYKNRYYDPQLGRFISPDRFVQNLADPQALNRYSYVRNNPANLVDPSGHFWFIPFIIAAVKAALIGAALNATVAAFTGGDVGKAALVGAAGGAIFGAGAFLAGAAAAGQTLSATLSRAAIMTGAGALAGTTGAAMTGQSLGNGAGVGAALGFLGAVVPTPSVSWFGHGSLGNFFNPVINSALKGSIIGAGAAAVQGQRIGRGALGGAVYYGTVALINSTLGAITHLPTISEETGQSNRPTVGYRYVGPREAEQIQRTGVVPNVTVKQEPKPVFFTYDDPLNSGSLAQRIYGLEQTPTHRVMIDPSQVPITYSSGFSADGGIATEGTTNAPIPVVEGPTPLDQ